MAKSNFLPRLITGTIYIAIILFALLTNSITLLGLVFALFAGLACFEFQSVTQINRHVLMLKIVHAIFTGLFFFVSFAWLLPQVNYSRYLVLLLPYIGYWLFYTIGELYRGRKDPIREVAFAFFAHLYIGLPLGLLVLLCLDSSTNVSGSLFLDRVSQTFWLLPIFSFVWLNDTGAYLVGSQIGKHKLFERISPKKTWEGFLGGMVFTLIGAAIYYWIWPNLIPLWAWAVLAILSAVFSTWGDLFESFIKRTYGVKDAGNILPGHGGILDRIDSVLFVAYPAYMFLSLLMHLSQQ